MAGVGRSSTRTELGMRWCCAPPGWQARPRGRCRGPAGGSRGPGRAARRSPPWPPGGRRHELGTCSRSRCSGSASFSLTRPSRIAKVTSWAWVPSWRSRSIRRSIAAEASTVWARACSKERSPEGDGVWPEQGVHQVAVGQDDDPHGPGSGEEQHDPGAKDRQPVQPARAPDRDVSGPEQGGGQAELLRLVTAAQRRDQAGEGVEPDAESSEEPHDGQRHLDGQIGDGPPGRAVPKHGLEPPEKAGPGQERIGLVDVLTEKLL